MLVPLFLFELGCKMQILRTRPRALKPMEFAIHIPTGKAVVIDSIWNVKPRAVVSKDADGEYLRGPASDFRHYKAENAAPARGYLARKPRR